VLSEVQDPWRHDAPAKAVPEDKPRSEAELRNSLFETSNEGYSSPSNEMNLAEMGQFHQLSLRAEARAADSWAIAMDGIVDPWANDGVSDAERLGVELIVDPWRPRP